MRKHQPHQRYAVTYRKEKQNDFFLILTQLSLIRCQRSIPARKYWVATNMAMKTVRVNDTSLRSWRRTRQRLDSYGADSQSAVRCFPEGNRPLSQGCVANMGNIDFGMTARFISGSRLLHTQRKEVMAHDERKLGISPWRYLLR